jgi:hypothetical protein
VRRPPRQPGSSRPATADGASTRRRWFEPAGPPPFQSMLLPLTRSSSLINPRPGLARRCGPRSYGYPRIGTRRRLMSRGIIDALTSASVMTFADKAYQGVGGTVRTPFKRHRYRPRLSRRQKAVSRSHARIRARGERARRHPQDMESPGQAALQPVPDDRDPASHPRSTPCREPALLMMEKAY